MFLFAVLPLILMAPIHFRGSTGMLSFSKSVPMKRQTHLGRLEGECILNGKLQLISFLGEMFVVHQPPKCYLCI